jgi:hypothetical protein
MHRKLVETVRAFVANKPLEIVDQGAFSIPGRYVEVGKQTIMVGQMYVQYQRPKHKTRPYPVVMIHGGGQTASFDRSCSPVEPRLFLNCSNMRFACVDAWS